MLLHHGWPAARTGAQYCGTAAAGKRAGQACQGQAALMNMLDDLRALGLVQLHAEQQQGCYAPGVKFEDNEMWPLLQVHGGL